MGNDVRTLRTLRTSPNPVGEKFCNDEGDRKETQNTGEEGDLKNVRNVRNQVEERCRIIFTDGDLDGLIERLKQSPKSPIGLIVQSGSLMPGDHTYSEEVEKLNWLGINFPGNETYVIDLGKQSARVKDLLEALDSHRILGHRLANSLTMLRREYGFDPRRVFCTETAFRILYNGLDYKHDLASCLERELGYHY